MKKTLTIIFLIFIATTLSAEKNWIEIEPTNKPQTQKPDIKTDVNLSQNEPINRIIKNVAAVKNMLDATSKEEKPTNDKKWFEIPKTN
ncbi:MAG: hypothetical protein WC274_00245 [Sulfurimonas sp.]|jgi:hypothetical protein